jgi:diguanylate cyclase (GGDEF)-like protein/PAS domain S-box-containing protein
VDVGARDVGEADLQSWAHPSGRAKARARLSPERRQQLLAGIAADCDEAILSTGPTGAVEIWNKAATRLFGWSEEDVVGVPANILVPPEREAEGADLLRRTWAGEVMNRVETVRLTRYGARVEVSISLGPLRGEGAEVVGVYQVVRDITQQKASERALAFQAMHDHLTGLPNRGLLEDRMGHALERCRREGTSIGVMFFDVDHFKDVNDTAGHEVGDRLLRAVASRLRQSVRSMDTVARLGGDEFVVLCEDITDDSQLEVVASHIMGGFSEPVVLPDRQLWVTLSCGIVRGGPSSSVAQLLSEADAAMYHAKARGRGTVGRYDPRTRPDLERKAEGSRLLRLALERHELVPYYQPIVDLHTGEVVAAEALVRWDDPGRGLIAAKEFIPLAEELGLISEISELVLAEAGRQAKAWAKVAPSVKVNVNVSPLQLRGTDLLSSARALVKDGVKPSSLVMEVTESALMEDATGSGSVLAELRDTGFGIAIDDFGTGYSSLAYLKQLPATAIKVDQAFTAQLPDPQDLSVVMAILAIADTYGLDVVAEGVETPQQAEVLKSLGCQKGQGYHFARPMPASDLSRWLTDTKLPAGPGH